MVEKDVLNRDAPFLDYVPTILIQADDHLVIALKVLKQQLQGMNQPD
jgi:hypothetical protein